ncbi:MAG: DUF6242 domain-containing protein [Bacteroidales bacterium]|nr:DUF6242 domain-containing protein [Bacteroidales bacterium]
MIRKLAICFAVVLAAANFIACNSTYESVEVTASCVAISKFTLTKNDSVMTNLDSVFFSIDLTKGMIFNADSLPCGTKVTALTPVITPLEGASLIELTVKRNGKADTTYNYTSKSNDTIDFTHPVSMRVVSPDGLTQRTYQIYVNVHKVESDTLEWSNVNSWRLPSDFANPDAQHSTAGKKRLFTLTSYQSTYCLSYYHNIHDLGNSTLNQAAHTARSIRFPFKPVIESFTALDDDTLYILADNNTLYRSTDIGSTWVACPQRWQTIIGSYQGSLLGITTGTSPEIEDLGRGTSCPLPQDMPVKGMSMPVYYDFEMASTPQLMIIGGRKADGSLSADTWGYDGNSWARISKKALPEGLEGMTTVPYYTFSVAGNLVATEISTILAFGGRKADGSVSKTVYASYDYGYNWTKAPDKLQLPDVMPATYDAQAFVLSTRMSASVTVPGMSRISRPSESWECPYIYLFGGRRADGTTCNTVWRGVINRMSFKPVE